MNGGLDPAAPGARYRAGGAGRRWRSVGLAVAAAILFGGLGPGPGIGATPAGAHGGGAAHSGSDHAPRLVLEEQTAWARTGEDFAARFRLPAGHGGAVVSARLHPAVDSVADVAATARQESLGRPLLRLPDVDVASGASTAVVRVAVGSRAEGRTELEPGVYPLVVEASTEKGDAPDPVVTHVVVVGAGQLGRRPVALPTRIHQPFRWTADGRLELEGGPDALAPRLVPLLNHLNVPYTLIPTPGTVAALSDTVDGSRSLQAVLTLARRGQVVNGPFARLPTGTWAAAALDQPLMDQFAAGQATLTAALAAPPTTDTWLLTPTDDLHLLRWLAVRGVDTFLVPRPSADPSDPAEDGEGAPPDEPFRIADVGSAHVGLAADVITAASGAVEEDDPAGPVARAHRLLAGLALPALTAPTGDQAGGDGGGRGAAARDRLGPPPAVLVLDDLGPDARPLVETLLAGLDQAGPLRPTTVDGLNLRPIPVPAAGAGRAGGGDGPDEADEAHDDATASQEADGAVPRWEPPILRHVGLGALPAQLTQARQQVDSFTATAGATNPAAVPLQRAVLTLGAEDLSPAERAAVLAALGSQVRAQLGPVALDRDQPVTVTAHRADVPVAIHNRGSRPLEVALRVDSSDLELVGPTRRQLRLEAGTTTEVAVPVRVNRSGDFRVRVEVTSPDGLVLLAERTLTVRSTAISGAGVVLSIGALCFLFLWWGRHVRRARRARVPLEVPARAESARVEEPVP